MPKYTVNIKRVNNPSKWIIDLASVPTLDLNTINSLPPEIQNPLMDFYNQQGTPNPSTAIQILSIEPRIGARSGDTVIVSADLNSFEIDECSVLFRKVSNGEVETAGMKRAYPINNNEFELCVYVPVFHGEIEKTTSEVYIDHYKYYSIDISPEPRKRIPKHIKLRDATSNAKKYKWYPGPPEIREFFVNNKSGNIVVKPGEGLKLSWHVQNVSEIEITDLSNTGPNVFIHTTTPSVQSNIEGNKDIGNFNGTKPKNEIYTLVAKNSFGVDKKTVTVRLRQQPDLKILGIEVSQAIQHFTLEPTITIGHFVTIPSSLYNNSVDLIEGKATLVRVYVDSGIVNGFSNGVLPNEQSGVSGKITVFFHDGTQEIIRNIWNPDRTIVSRPQYNINRNELAHTLNFEIPWDLLKRKNPFLPVKFSIEAQVWVEKDVDGQTHEADSIYSGYKDTHRTKEFILKQTKKLKLVEVLVRDDKYGFDAPSDSDFWFSLDGMITRYPIARDGVEIWIAPGFEVYGTTCDLYEGMEDLLDEIEDIADDFEDIDEYWCALVPNEKYCSEGTCHHGIATTGGNCMVARARSQETFAHELGHNLGIRHSDCGDPDNVDPDLPAHTSELSVDVLNRELIPTGYGDLMSYCDCDDYDREKFWPSLTLWNKLCEKLS
jgi:hypothetical protein